MSAQAKERLMKLRSDLRSMPGELPSALFSEDQGSAETGTLGERLDASDAAGTTLVQSVVTDVQDAAERTSSGARAGFRFRPALKPSIPQHDLAEKPAATLPAESRGDVSESRPGGRHSFSFAARRSVDAGEGSTSSAADSPPAREGRDGDFADTGEPDEFEVPPVLDAADLDDGFEQVAPTSSARRDRFNARVESRDAHAAPAFFGYQADGGVGGDKPCGIPGSAFIGYPSDLPIGTAYSRAVWSRASRQADPGHAVLEIRTAHGGSAMVLAPWSQRTDTHGSNVSPWADIDRALLIEVKYRAHAEQGYRNVKVGAAGFQKEMGTVEIDPPDLSSLKRELGGPAPRVFCPT